MTESVLYEFKDTIIPSWKCKKCDGISPIYHRLEKENACLIF